jgi:phosphoglycerate dehydrogenase-like enzyme
MFQKAVMIGIAESALTPATWGGLDKLIQTRVSIKNEDTQEQLSQLADADCLLVDFLTTVNKEIIDAAPNLKYIGLWANAYDRVDVEYAAKKDIPVCNLHGFCRESVAELVIAMLLIDLRRLDEERLRGKSGNYEYSEVGIEDRRDLQGLSFGVVGLGSIGSRVAELADCFGCRVSYYSPTRKETQFTYKELDTLLTDSDVVSVHPTLNPSSNHMIDAAKINLLKSGTTLIVTGPMELVDIDALATRLAKGDMRFITDHAELLSSEELAKLSPFKNCIMYPPVGPVTRNAQENKQAIFIQNIEAALKGDPNNRVN